MFREGIPAIILDLNDHRSWKSFKLKKLKSETFSKQSDARLHDSVFCSSLLMFTLKSRRTTPSRTSHLVLPLTPMQPIRKWRGRPSCDGKTCLILDAIRPTVLGSELYFHCRSHLSPLAVLVQADDHLHVSPLLPHPSLSTGVVQQHV